MLSITKYVFQSSQLISKISVHSVAVNNEINSIINNIINIYQSGDIPSTLHSSGKTIIFATQQEANFHKTTHPFRVYDNEVKPQSIIKTCRIQEGKFRPVATSFKMTAAEKESRIKPLITDTQLLTANSNISSTISTESYFHKETASTVTVQSQLLKDPVLNTEHFTTHKIKNPDTAAATIVKAFRTMLSQRSHHHMILTGEIWQKENTKNVYNGVQELSKNNLRRLNHEIAYLSPQERKFLNVFMEMTMYATHSTPVNIKSANGTVSLFSRQKLIERNIIFNKNNSPDDDIRLLGNDDFVFFSLEIGDEPKKPSSRFGGTVFRFNFENKTFFDNAWLSLVEMRFSQTPALNRHVDGLTEEEYAKLSKRTLNPFSTVFSGGDIKSGIVLSIIKDIRNHLSVDSQHNLLARTDEKNLNSIVNGLYRPEVKVGRQFFSKDYMETEIKKDEKG